MNGAPSVSTVETRLPKQVQKAVRRAQMLERQQRERLNGTDTSPESGPTGSPATSAPNVASAPSATPQEGTQQTQPDVVATGSTDQAHEMTAQEAPAVTPTLDASAKHWQNRYHALQGVIRTVRNERSDEVASLQSTIAGLQTELATAKAASVQPTTLKLEDYFTAEQIDALGEDRAAAVLRASHDSAMSAVRSQVETLLAPIRQREKAEQERTQREATQRQADAETKFFDDLGSAVPNWQTINARKDWLAWLAEFDMEAMRIRQDLVDEARAANDARPIVALLQKFIRSTPSAPQPSVMPSANDAGNGGGGPSPSQEPARILTAVDVKRMYTALATNRKLTDAQRDAEGKRIDALVQQAQANGTFRR